MQKNNILLNCLKETLKRIRYSLFIIFGVNKEDFAVMLTMLVIEKRVC